MVASHQEEEAVPPQETGKSLARHTKQPGVRARLFIYNLYNSRTDVVLHTTPFVPFCDAPVFYSSNRSSCCAEWYPNTPCHNQQVFPLRRECLSSLQYRPAIRLRYIVHY